MELTDTHCHIQSVGAAAGERHTRELWAKAGGMTPDGVIQNAVETGVTRLVCVGCDLEDSRLAVEFVKSRENCWASVGIHPHEAQHYLSKTAQSQFASLLEDEPSDKKIVAVGECGLDFYYNHSPKEVQIEMLKFQLELAKKHDLPVIFHVREAFADFWPLYDRYRVRGVLHSFTDSSENLARALERQLYIGVNGIATFTKSAEQLEMYASVPLGSLLLETDAPYLTPTPYRGTVNEPKHIPEIAAYMAQLQGVAMEELAAATTQNAVSLFNLK